MMFKNSLFLIMNVLMSNSFLLQACEIESFEKQMKSVTSPDPFGVSVPVPQLLQVLFWTLEDVQQHPVLAHQMPVAPH